jgi:hypothetical protein
MGVSMEFDVSYQGSYGQCSGIRNVVCSGENRREKGEKERKC